MFIAGNLKAASTAFFNILPPCENLRNKSKKYFFVIFCSWQHLKTLNCKPISKTGILNIYLNETQHII